MTIRVGTSGWAYPQWKPDFYPRDLPQRRFLEHYATRLPSCEVNNTFYKVPDETLLSRWADATPSEFRFAIKVHRRLTHARDISPRGEQGKMLVDFMSLVAGMGDRLGPLLFQLPQSKKADLDLLDALCRVVPEEIAFAFEFNDESWNQSAIDEILTRGGGTRCYTDRTREVPQSLPPGRVAYVRLRGGDYSTDQQIAWRRLFEKESEARPVFAFVKHDAEHPGPDAGINLALKLNDADPRV